MQQQTLYFYTITIKNYQLSVYCDWQGLCFLSLNNCPSYDKLIFTYLKYYPNSKIEKNQRETEKYFTWITKYFENPNNFIINEHPLHLIGTKFQVLVWKQLLKIPSGILLTYQDIAYQLKIPTATRAVASAIGKNNILIIVPCHRIINKNPKIINFSAGIEKKIFLQTHEQK